MPENPLLLHWFLPTGGDGRDPGGVTAVQGRTGAATRRPADIGYLAQVARAAEQAGFHSLLTPVGLGCVDPWILTAALTQHTDRIGFLVAFRAGFASPTLLAQQADAFRRFAGGRLRLNVVTGGDPAEQRAYGDHLDHDRRYERTDEVMGVLRDLLDGKRVDHHGEHLRIDGAQLHEPAVQYPVPLYFGGASPAAEAVAVRRADVQLLWGEPPRPSPGASTGSAPQPPNCVTDYGCTSSAGTPPPRRGRRRTAFSRASTRRRSGPARSGSPAWTPPARPG